MEHSGKDQVVPSPATDGLPLFGRTASIQQLIGFSAGVVIVTGDSGIGKSALLDRSVDLADPLEFIAPQVIRVRHNSGALKYALLDSLQRAIEEVILQKGEAQTIASHIEAAATKLVQEKAKQLPIVIGKILLGALRDRIGPEAADVIAEFVGELRNSSEDDLSSRLAAESGRDAIDVLIAFVAEVQMFADRPVVLSLDGGERLSEEDLALFADLCEQLPPDVRVRIGFSTHDVESQRKVEGLVIAGAQALRLESLTIADVRKWMESRGVDSSKVGDVMRLTDGYPLYVQDVITYVENGEDIGKIEAANKLSIFTDRSWRSLDLPVAVIARKISGFTDPPPLPRLLTFLDLNIHAWTEFERRLQAARIFCAKVNGRPWFHELRRRYVWESILSADERSEVAHHTVKELLDEFVTERRFSVLGTIADLANQSQPHATDPDVASTLAMGSAALAVAAALIELAEPASAVPALATSAVLDYARSVFNPSGDLISGLHDLEDRGLISFTTSSNSVVLPPQWKTPIIPAIIAGRTANELGRVPVSGAASMIFQDAVEPALGRFATAQYGMGRPDMAQLAASIPPRRSGTGPDSAVFLGTHQPSIGMRGVFGGAPVFACVTYEEDSARDSSLPGIQGLHADPGGVQFSIVDAIALPSGAIASRRFLNAAELVVGKTLLGSSKIQMDRALPIDEALSIKADTIKYVRSRSSRLERIAYGVDEPTGYVCWKGDSTSVFLTIMGGRERADLMQGKGSFPAVNPYTFLEMAERASLAPSERVREITRMLDTESTRDSPVVEALGELQKTAYAFNKHGERHEVVVSRENLETEIWAALARRRIDAHQIAQLMGLPTENLRSLVPRKYYLVVIPVRVGTQGFPVSSLAEYCWEPLEGGETDEIEVHVEPRWEQEVTTERLRQTLAKAFKIDPATMSGGGLYGNYTIASFLAYDSEHITLRFADDI